MEHDWCGSTSKWSWQRMHSLSYIPSGPTPWATQLYQLSTSCLPKSSTCDPVRMYDQGTSNEAQEADARRALLNGRHQSTACLHDIGSSHSRIPRTLWNWFWRIHSGHWNIERGKCMMFGIRRHAGSPKNIKKSLPIGSKTTGPFPNLHRFQIHTISCGPVASLLPLEPV